MTFKTSRRVYRFSAKILALLILVGPLCGAAWSQKTSSQKSSQSVQSLPTTVPSGVELSWYIAARYSIFGPAPINTIDSKSITFTGGHGLPGVNISLANKNVTVMNEAGFSLPFSSLGSGVRVTVCDRSDSVVIITVPSSEASNAKR